MSRYMRVTIFKLLITSVLIGCNNQASQPEVTSVVAMPTQLPTSTYTSVPASAVTPNPKSEKTPELIPTDDLVCNLNDVLVNLNSLMPNNEYEVSYQNFSLVGESFLTIWYVDPEIDVNVDHLNIEMNAVLAIRKAAELSHKLALSDKCVSEIVDGGISPVIVDQNYNSWFSGAVSLESIPNTQVMNDDVLRVIENAFQIGYIRQTLPEPIAQLPATSCDWPEAHENIKQHFPPEQSNMSFHLIRDGNGTTVYAQWLIPTGFDEITVYGFNIASVMNILSELPCLYPPADTLIAMAIDDNGDLKFVGRMFGDAIRKMDIEQLDVRIP